jgi:flagellar hook-associated protein 3 FlgL
MSGFRVTQNMLNNQLLGNLNSNNLRMQQNQDQLSTGRRINKASDDPVGITYGLRYRSENGANTQYESNSNAAISSLDYTDTTLNQAGDVLQRVRELTVQASSGTNSAESLKAIKSEISQLNEQMVTVGNSQFNGKYIFNGQLTNIPPYTAGTADTDITDSENINFELGTGVKIAISITGNTVFGEPGDPNNVFKTIKDIQTALDTNDFQNLTHNLGRLDKGMDKFLEARADVGAKSNRIELILNRIKDTGTNLTSMQSKVEDADIPTVITNLKTDQNVYQSSLSVGAKLISTSLIDFLK